MQILLILFQCGPISANATSLHMYANWTAASVLGLDEKTSPYLKRISRMVSGSFVMTAYPGEVKGPIEEGFPIKSSNLIFCINFSFVSIVLSFC